VLIEGCYTLHFPVLLGRGCGFGTGRAREGEVRRVSFAFKLGGISIHTSTSSLVGKNNMHR